MDNNIKTFQEDKVLKLLEDCINTYLDRTEQYGDWRENISNAISEAKEKYGKDYTSEDYLIPMITLKNARNSNKTKRDSVIDKIVYTTMLYLTQNNE